MHTSVQCDLSLSMPSGKEEQDWRRPPISLPESGRYDTINPESMDPSLYTYIGRPDEHTPMLMPTEYNYVYDPDNYSSLQNTGVRALTPIPMNKEQYLEEHEFGNGSNKDEPRSNTSSPASGCGYLKPSCHIAINTGAQALNEEDNSTRSKGHRFGNGSNLCEQRSNSISPASGCVYLTPTCH